MAKVLIADAPNKISRFNGVSASTAFDSAGLSSAMTTMTTSATRKETIPLASIFSPLARWKIIGILPRISPIKVKLVAMG